jgi:Flp pilus assembly protein TadB
MNTVLVFTLIFLSFIMLSQSGNKRVDFLRNKNISLNSNFLKLKKVELDTDWLEELAAKLQSGSPARVALRNSLEKTSLFNTKNACQNGASISAALLADQPNDEVARALSSCWDISEEAGIGLATAVGQLAKGVQMKVQLEEELTSALSQAKLSLWVLAALPLFGLLLAGAIGENPLIWLFTNKFGQMVLIFGLSLEALGIYWVSRITNRVRRQL